MRVAIVVVGKRTEHWEGLFKALARKPDLDLLLQVADVSQVAEERLGRLAGEHPRLTSAWLRISWRPRGSCSASGSGRSSPRGASGRCRSWRSRCW